MPRSLWKPVLPQPLRDRALEAVQEIAEDLFPFSRFGKRLWPEDTFSLSRGRAGVALFFAYLDRALPGCGHGERALVLLEESIEAAAGVETRPDLYSGFVGMAWALEHLRGWLVDDEEDDPGAEAAAAVEAVVRQSPWTREYDLICGLVGIGVYALERLPRPGGLECLRHVADRLRELALQQDEGVAWLTPPARVRARTRESKYPEGFFNLGVSHGVPGVIAWLAETHAAGLEVRPLLDQAVSWMLRQKLPPESEAVFPNGVAPGTSPSPSRLAWCYGDPGVAVTLMNAARRTGNPAWEHEARAVLRAAAARRHEPPQFDAGLCHGSAGLAHLFNRMFQATGEPSAREAAIHWVERTLGLRRPGEGVAGFVAWSIDENHEKVWKGEPGLQVGAAGIGLALLAAAAPIEPGWDRVLLASLPPHERPGAPSPRGGPRTAAAARG